MTSPWRCQRRPCLLSQSWWTWGRGWMGQGPAHFSPRGGSNLEGLWVTRVFPRDDHRNFRCKRTV